MSAPIMARPMRAEDLPDVLKIEHASYSTPWPESSFRGLIGRPDTDLFVADGDGEVAGYAVSWAVIDQGELGNIAVAPTWRRRGVGNLLLERVIEAMQARGVKELFLEVRVSNQVAQRLYRAHGFHEVGVRRDYYSIPVEDALVMRLALDS